MISRRLINGNWMRSIFVNKEIEDEIANARSLTA